MKTYLICLAIYLSAFTFLTWNGGTPERGHEMLHWTSIAIVSAIPLAIIGVFQLLHKLF